MAAVVPPPAQHGQPQQHHQRLNKMTDLTDVSAISCDFAHLCVETFSIEMSVVSLTCACLLPIL